MAFGKNANDMKGVSPFNASFRQMSGQLSKSNTGSKPRSGGIPYFVDMYSPSTEYTDTIRLVQGEYIQPQIEGEGDDAVVTQVIMPFIKFTDHFDGAKKKGGICSAGPFANVKDKREPCHGCDIYWETAVRNAEGRFQSPRMSRQNKYAFNVFDYGVYHKLEQYDDQGKVRMNSVTKEAYFNWVKCQGQGCDACRAQKEAKQGNMSHWPINYTQLQVLRSAEVDIGKSCVVCHTKDTITSLGWTCPHCQDGVIDMATTDLKTSELLELTDKPYTCLSCGETGFLVDNIECGVCARTGQTGVRASLFDVDLNVKVLVGPTGNKVLQVMGWSAPGPVQPPFDALIKPLDLIARYAPEPLERQALKFGVVAAGPKREPQTGATGVPAARAYKNPFGPKTP